LGTNIIARGGGREGGRLKETAEIGLEAGIFWVVYVEKRTGEERKIAWNWEELGRSGKAFIATLIQKKVRPGKKYKAVGDNK